MNLRFIPLQIGKNLGWGKGKGKGMFYLNTCLLYNNVFGTVSIEILNVFSVRRLFKAREANSSF